MIISATIKNQFQFNDITVSTEGHQKKINIPAKEEGVGSAVNGGELLFLSLATCFCNDVYREANKRKLNITSVEVIVSGEFGKEGEPGSNIVYNVSVQSPTLSQKEITELISQVDKIAEVHNTLRKGVAVTLKTA
jgi:organic hydroperoxide reductase OsmC/OhrA